MIHRLTENDIASHEEDITYDTHIFHVETQLGKTTMGMNTHKLVFELFRSPLC